MVQPKHTRKRQLITVFASLFIGLLVVTTTASWALTIPGGVPTVCLARTPLLFVHQTITLTCDVGGLAIKDQQFTSVPSGYVFLATDIAISHALSSSFRITAVDFTVTRFIPTPARLIYGIRVEERTDRSFGRTFTTPILIVPENHGIRAQNIGELSIDGIAVSGILAPESEVILP